MILTRLFRGFSPWKPQLFKKRGYAIGKDNSIPIRTKE